jgi:hypothetical protein
VELHQLESSAAVRSLHHREPRPYALEPHDAVHPATPDGPLALQLESELDEKLSRGREVVNDDAHVVHPLDRHVLDGKDAALEPRCHAPDGQNHVFRSSDITFCEPIVHGTRGRIR